MRGIFSWKNYAKIFKMGIDKFAQIMYNRYNGGIWDIDKKIMSERTEKEKEKPFETVEMTMENMIQAITEAEEKAAAIKAEALARAEAILSEAERKAAETEKSARDVCKAFRATQTKLAAQKADEQYSADVAKVTAEAKANSEKIMQNVDSTVTKIVGRIISGDC